MAFNDELAERVRDLLSARSGISERKMFGGIGFMVDGNIVCGVIGDDLIVRLGSEEAAERIEDPHAREFDLTGRPMRNWIYVEPAGTSSADDFEDWVEGGFAYASSLPPK